jgi:hypothetical protein
MRERRSSPGSGSDTALDRSFSTSFSEVSCCWYSLSIGFRKLQGKIPLANSDPFAVAAAYHPPEEDKDTTVKGMMRGEIDT